MQVLTGVVAAVLLFRYAVKAWVYWALPKVSTPGRIWGLEDLFFVLGFCCDVTHMSFVWKR